MYEWSLVTQCCAVSEISYVNGVMRKERIIIIIIIITRQLQSLVTVRELTSIETRQKVGLAIGWIDIQGCARPVI